MQGFSLDALFAAERLLPATGGAERFAVEALEHLAGSHRVRAVWLGDPAPPPAGVEGAAAAPRPHGAYWRSKRLASEAIEWTVAAEVRRRAADVVVTQLHAAPGAVAAAAGAGIPSVLLVPSYEALCKYAFDAGSECVPEACAERCPAVLALAPDERLEHRLCRAAQRQAVAAADALVAPSEFVADACERWSGRRPAVVPPVAGATPPTRAPAADGQLVLAAATWSVNKGVELLEPIVDGLPARRFLVTANGLDGRLERRPNVTLSPPRPVEELLAGAALALVPSQMPEPFGRIAFEAAAAGVPCLAAARGGLTEVVPEQELVDRASDPAAWIAAVSSLTHAAAWRAAQARARERAAAILALEPLRRFEDLLLQAASR